MMEPNIAVRLGERLRAALLGAAAGEAAAEAPAGVRQLLDFGDHLVAQRGFVDPAALAEAGFAEPPGGGKAALLLRAVPIGLLSPLDRPRLRLAAHRAATVAGADEGTAMTAVATAVLAADLCRFDLDTALVRLRQTLLEEAPSALHVRLRVLGWSEPVAASGDPGAALQLALTAVSRSDDVWGAINQATGFAGDVGAAAALAGSLAGALHGLPGADDESLAAIPGATRIDELAARLAAVATVEAALRSTLRSDAARALARITDRRAEDPGVESRSP